MKVRKMSKNKKKRYGFPKQGWKASLIKHMPSCKYNLSKSFTSYTEKPQTLWIISHFLPNERVKNRKKFEPRMLNNFCRISFLLKIKPVFTTQEFSRWPCK